MTKWKTLRRNAFFAYQDTNLFEYDTLKCAKDVCWGLSVNKFEQNNVWSINDCWSGNINERVPGKGRVLNSQKCNDNLLNRVVLIIIFSPHFCHFRTVECIDKGFSFLCLTSCVRDKMHKEGCKEITFSLIFFILQFMTSQRKNDSDMAGTCWTVQKGPKTTWNNIAQTTNSNWIAKSEDR